MIKRMLVGLLALGSLSLHAGNGAGYGGGENLALKQARELLLLSLTLLKEGRTETYDLLGDEAECSRAGEPKLCQLITVLSEAQRTQLRTFAKEVAPAMAALVAGPKATKVVLSEPPLDVRDAKGNPLPVGAKTRLSPDGEILLHADSAKLLSTLSLVALLAHEFGHKVKFSGKFTEDNGPMGAFQAESGGGREMLDAFGASMALLASRFSGKVPVVFPSQVACRMEEREPFLRRAAYFSGSEREIASESPFVKAPTQFLNEMKRKPFTITVWAKADATSAPGILFSSVSYDAETPHGVEIARLKNGNLAAYIAGNPVFDSKVVLAPGEFHLISLVREEDEAKLFLDGKSIGKFSLNEKNVKSEAQFTIGQSTHAGQGAWKGHIALISFFPRALTAGEVQTLATCQK